MRETNEQITKVYIKYLTVTIGLLHKCKIQTIFYYSLIKEICPGVG